MVPKVERAADVQLVDEALSSLEATHRPRPADRPRGADRVGARSGRGGTDRGRRPSAWRRSCSARATTRLRSESRSPRSGRSTPPIRATSGTTPARESHRRRMRSASSRSTARTGRSAIPTACATPRAAPACSASWASGSSTPARSRPATKSSRRRPEELEHALGVLAALDGAAGSGEGAALHDDAMIDEASQAARRGGPRSRPCGWAEGLVSAARGSPSRCRGAVRRRTLRDDAARRPRRGRDQDRGPGRRRRRRRARASISGGTELAVLRELQPEQAQRSRSTCDNRPAVPSSRISSRIRRRLLEPSRRGPAKLGLRYDDLKHVNQRIVCVSLSGFGTTGPRAAEGAYDATVQGLAGWMA